jgi:hypothetical protein
MWLEHLLFVLTLQVDAVVDVVVLNDDPLHILGKATPWVTVLELT